MTTCNQLAHSHVRVLLKPLRPTAENESAHFNERRKDFGIYKYHKAFWEKACFRLCLSTTTVEEKDILSCLA